MTLEREGHGSDVVSEHEGALLARPRVLVFFDYA